MDAVWLVTADRTTSTTSRTPSISLSLPTAPSPRLKPKSISSTTFCWAASCSSLRRDAEQALSHRRHIPLRATRAAATQPRWRILAQAALPQPDVARWPLHGRAFLRGIRLDLASSGRLQRHHPPVRLDGGSTHAIRRPACSITDGTSRSRSAGPTGKRATRRNSGRAARAGT